MGNALCVPKGRKGRESTKGTKDRTRATTKSTKRNRRSRCQRSVDVDSRLLCVGNEEPLVQKNEIQYLARDCSSENGRSSSDSRRLSTDSVQAQPSSTASTSEPFPGTTSIAEVSEVPVTCTTVETVRATDASIGLLPNAIQGASEQSSVEIRENGQTSFVQNIFDESIIPASTSTYSARTTGNVTNGEGLCDFKGLHSNPEALDIELTDINNDLNLSEKHYKILEATSLSDMQDVLEPASNTTLTYKKQQSMETSSADIKEITDENKPDDTFKRGPEYDNMVQIEGPVSLQNSTSFLKIDKVKLEMNIAICEDDDAINPSEKCDIADITFTENPYHGDGDMDKKYKDNLNGKDSVTCDIIPCVDSDTQTKTPDSGIQPDRCNKSSHNSDGPGKGHSGSDKTEPNLQKRNSLLKEQLIEAVRRNQELNVLHNKDNRMELIPRAKSFYRENNAPALRCKHDKLCDSKLVGVPVRKVSDFEVPKLPPCPPDMPTPLNTKTHVNTIPDVAKSEAQNKITWRQTENQSSSGGQAWVSRTPVFKPPAQPLGERVLDLFGSVDRMKRSWVIPECRQIETLKLEHCIYPGLYVYPRMRWQFAMDTTNRQDKSNKRRDSDKPRTNGVVNRRKMPEQQSRTKPKSKSGGLTRWSRYNNINNLHKDRH